MSKQDSKNDHFGFVKMNMNCTPQLLLLLSLTQQTCSTLKTTILIYRHFKRRERKINESNPYRIHCFGFALRSLMFSENINKCKYVAFSYSLILTLFANANAISNHSKTECMYYAVIVCAFCVYERCGILSNQCASLL